MLAFRLSSELNFPKNKIPANSKLIIVGFIYKKTGLSKYIVKPPNSVINIPLTKGTIGNFFSKK